MPGRSLEEVHKAVMDRMAEGPQGWDARMAPWLAEGSFLQMLEANSQRYYLYLNALVAETKPKRVLELGTCEGGSALFMMLALPAGASLTTVDIEEREPWQAKAFFGDTRLKRLVGNDLSLRVYGAHAPCDIDLLFIDTVHEYEHVAAELALYLPLMAPGGVVVMDDISISLGMKRLWEGLKLEKLDLGPTLHWSGFGIARVGGVGSAHSPTSKKRVSCETFPVREEELVLSADVRKKQ